jgi:isopentenyl-diphosphate delta-isomerase
MKVIVKEVGQGMGPESIERLMQLPIEAFELAAFGGTNFARVELARSEPAKQDLYSPLARIGHPAGEMLDLINGMISSGKPVSCRQVIISGGISSFLDGYFLTSKCLLPSVFGQASGFLRFARGDYEELRKYVTGQINGLKFARAFLKVKHGA